MVAKQKHFLDSLRQMVSRSPDEVCPNCKKPHDGDLCPDDGNANGDGEDTAVGTAYLVDLVSNHKIRIPIPTCQVGRDETNDIVVSGDQSISRHHLNLLFEDNQYYLEDMGSRHGTFLNGTQLTTREVINDGDVIKIGVSLFWFVVESADGRENGPDVNPESGTKLTDLSTTTAGEPAHLKVKSDMPTSGIDSASSTMNEIPVIPTESSLIERLRLKTRSFDQAGLFANAQSQAATISPQMTSIPSQTVGDTQSQIPAMSLDPLTSEGADRSAALANKYEEPLADSGNGYETAQNDYSAAPELHAMPEKTAVPERHALPEKNATPAPVHQPAQEMNMSPQDLISGSTIYDQLMGNDLSDLVKKYNSLKEQIDRAEKERGEIADQLNAIRELGTNLIGGREQPLIESCYKVFSKLGWQISLNSNDSQELQLKSGDHLCIARIIWSNAEPERSHLGQLSISQTQQWCDQGQEPKGILIVSRLANANGDIPALSKGDYESELAKHAAKKNVCMMTSMQILAIYRDLVLKHSDINALREKIINSAGWLEGFTIKSP